MKKTTKSLALSLVQPVLAVALATAAFPVATQASLLYGTLNIGGSVNISTGKIDFVPGPTSGVFTVGPSTGDYAVLNGTTGTEKNIDNPPYVVNTMVTTTNFLTFTALPNISFTLNMLVGGSDGVGGCTASPAAGGQICTPAPPISAQLSPFNLNNTTATTSSASFNVSGVEVDSLTNTSTPFTGIYTAQFTVPYQTLLNAINSGNTITTTYSASFTTSPVPEPSTALMFACGAALLGLGVAVRRVLPIRS